MSLPRRCFNPRRAFLLVILVPRPVGQMVLALDLTPDFSAETLYGPTACSFVLEQEFQGRDAARWLVSERNPKAVGPDTAGH